MGQIQCVHFLRYSLSAIWVGVWVKLSKVGGVGLQHQGNPYRFTFPGGSTGDPTFHSGNPPVLFLLAL